MGSLKKLPMWLGMPKHIQLKILVPDLSFLQVATARKVFEIIH